MNFAHAALIALLFASATAAAQTPGLGETRPADPAPREEAPSAPNKATPLPPQDKARSDRDLGRCRELTGAARADCLREDRAASGSTRRDEPPSAPPPQNPR